MARVSVTKPSTFQQYKTLLAKDLRQEFRTREMLTSMGIYAFLVIIVYGAALALTAHGLDIMRMGGGLLWVLIVFTSLLGLARSFAHEKEQGCMEGILMVPLDRSVVFLAKTTANFLFMLVVEVIAVPLFYFFFMSAEQVAPTFAWIVAPLFVGTLGMAGIGTMLSTITMNTRAKDVMLAVLFIPLIYPLLYACVTATTTAIMGTEFWTDFFIMPLVRECSQQYPQQCTSRLSCEASQNSALHNRRCHTSRKAPILLAPSAPFQHGSTPCRTPEISLPYSLKRLLWIGDCSGPNFFVIK